MVSKELQAIVQAAIDQTEAMMENGQVTAEVATRGIEKMALDLIARWPEHELWIKARLCEWLRGRAN